MKERIKAVLIYHHGDPLAQGMPLAFSYLKSNIDNARHDVKIIDCALDNIEPESSEFINRIKDIEPRVAGIYSKSVTFPKAVKIAEIIKQINPGIATILGGPHATVYAEKVIENKEFNYLFRGEGELFFPVFLDEMDKTVPDFSKVKGLVYRDERGKAVFNEIARVEDLDSIRIPDYDAINLDRYIKKGYNNQIFRKRCAPIYATRGCPYKCGFCSAPVVSGRQIRRHSIEYLVNWIKVLYKEHEIRGFNMIDDNFTFDKEFAKGFCREIIKLGYKDIEFNSPNGIRMQRGDFELWSLMQKTGWRTVTVAPESGSERVLKRMKKDIDIDKIPSIINDMKRAGLKVHGFFMVGYPDETIEDLKKTELFIKKHKFHALSISKFQPVPGTPIFDELVKSGVITADALPTDYDDYKHGYTPDTLKDFDFSKFIRKIYAPAYIIKWVYLFMKDTPVLKNLLPIFKRGRRWSRMVTVKSLIQIMTKRHQNLTYSQK